MSNPTNAKGKKFSWSFSGLQDFEGCPARYAAARFYCTLPFQETAAMRWGNRVHKAAEMFLRGVPHSDNEALLPVEEYCTAILRSGHRAEAELEITLTRDLRRTGWFASDAWLRCKLDVVVTKVKQKSVMYYDWKTGGKIKECPDQLNLCLAALSQIRPEVESFSGKFIWTQHKVTTGVAPVSRDRIPAIWGDFLPRVARMEEAWETEMFPARPSGLCPWCPVAECPKRRN